MNQSSHQDLPDKVQKKAPWQTPLSFFGMQPQSQQNAMVKYPKAPKKKKGK